MYKHINRYLKSPFLNYNDHKVGRYLKILSCVMIPLWISLMDYQLNQILSYPNNR